MLCRARPGAGFFVTQVGDVTWGRAQVSSHSSGNRGVKLSRPGSQGDRRGAYWRNPVGFGGAGGAYREKLSSHI